VSRVHRTDLATLEPVERLPDGTIKVDAYLTRTGVFEYHTTNGGIRRELRLPEDVFDDASLKSFEGVLVTNDHPSDMVDPANYRAVVVGAQAGPVRRGDEGHIRSKLRIYDPETVRDLDNGKRQISCGYTCDTIEVPGVHPVYGPYDAIQKNVRGNHVAIVDRARAGSTAAARMDGWAIDLGATIGTAIAIAPETCNSMQMAKKLDIATVETNDPDDLATRNAKIEIKRAVLEDDTETEPDAEPDADPDDRDAYDDSMDADGNLTDAAVAKIQASNFAQPGKGKMPIHDKAHVRAAMKRFGDAEFDSADEKHAAFNRIVSKAKQLGCSTDGFERAHGNKLDTYEGPIMTPDEIKELQAKCDSRKAKLGAAKARIDELEIELARRDGLIKSLETDLATAKTPVVEKNDAADLDLQTRVDAKVALITQALATGAAVDAKMSEDTIRRTVIKHVDGDDVPADKVPAYVEALYDGALKRANKDAKEVAKADAALASLRQPIAFPVTATPHADASDTDEDAARARMRSASVTQWQRKETK
jgi:hypothetical protein